MKNVFQVQEFLSFRLCQTGSRNSGPVGNNLPNLFFSYFLFQELVFLILINLFLQRIDFLLQLRKGAVFQLGQFLQVVTPFCGFNFVTQFFQFLFLCFQILNPLLFIFPFCPQLVVI